MMAENSGDRISRVGLIVTVMCVGLVLLLVFPYLLQRRAAARRDTCQLNLTRISLALAAYSDVHQSLPFGTEQVRDLPPEKRLSWYPQIWPHLSEFASRLPLNYAEPWDSDHNLTVRAYLGGPDPPEKMTDASLLVCPAMQYDRTSDTLRPTSYVGIAGVGTDAPELEITDPSAGAWGYDRCTSTDLLAKGWANVLLLGEVGQETGPWSAGGWPTIRGLNPELSQLIGASGPLGGNHAGGTNVLIAEAVQFMADTVDTRVITQLAVIRSAPAADADEEQEEAQSEEPNEADETATD